MKLLRAWLILAAEGDPDPPEDPTLDDLADLADPEPEPPRVDEPDEPPELKTAKQRAKDLEAQLESERAARRALESRPAPIVQPSPSADADYEREERELAEARAKGASPEQMYWLQFKIDTDRRARKTERTLSQVAIDSKDAADQIAFRQLEQSKPNFYKRYAPRVEQLAAEYRAKGQIIPREVILKMLVGDDMVTGKIKPKTSRPAATGEDGKVNRGQPQQVRSDVQAKGGRPKSIKDKRDWANTPI